MCLGSVAGYIQSYSLGKVVGYCQLYVIGESAYVRVHSIVCVQGGCLVEHVCNVQFNVPLWRSLKVFIAS